MLHDDILIAHREMREAEEAVARKIAAQQLGEAFEGLDEILNHAEKIDLRLAA